MYEIIIVLIIILIYTYCFEINPYLTPFTKDNIILYNGPKSIEYANTLNKNQIEYELLVYRQKLDMCVAPESQHGSILDNNTQHVSILDDNSQHGSILDDSYKKHPYHTINRVVLSNKIHNAMEQLTASGVNLSQIYYDTAQISLHYNIIVTIIVDDASYNHFKPFLIDERITAPNKHPFTIFSNLLIKQI